MLSIARNLLRYQQIEQALKVTLPYLKPVGGKGKSPLSTVVAWTPKGVLGMTLGQLHRHLTATIERTIIPDPGLEREAPTIEDLIERERRVIEDRSRLVHHLDHSHLAGVDGSKALIADLNAAHARSKELLIRVASMAAALMHAMSLTEMPDSDNPIAEAAEMRRMAEALFDQLEVRFEPDPDIDAWQDPAATLWSVCSDEWMPLGKARQLLYAAAPIAQERVKASGGLARWVTTLNFIEMRQVNVEGTQRGRAEIRRRTPPMGTPPKFA